MYNKCDYCGKYFRPNESPYKNYCCEQHKQEHNKKKGRPMIEPVKK